MRRRRIFEFELCYSSFEASHPVSSSKLGVDSVMNLEKTGKIHENRH